MVAIDRTRAGGGEPYQELNQEELQPVRKVHLGTSCLPLSCDLSLADAWEQSLGGALTFGFWATVQQLCMSLYPGACTAVKAPPMQLCLNSQITHQSLVQPGNPQTCSHQNQRQR